MLRFRFVLALPLALVASAALAQPSDEEPAKKSATSTSYVKGAKEIDGLFKLYHKDDHVYNGEPAAPGSNRPRAGAAASRPRGPPTAGPPSTATSSGCWLFRRVGDTDPPDPPQCPLQGEPRHAGRQSR